jgi:hypothetical protein
LREPLGSPRGAGYTMAREEAQDLHLLRQLDQEDPNSVDRNVSVFDSQIGGGCHGADHSLISAGGHS